MHLCMIWWDKYILKMWNLLPLSQACETKSSTSAVCSMSLFSKRPALTETFQNTTALHNRCNSTSKERRMISLPFMSNIEIDRSYLHGRAQSSSGLGSQLLMCNTLFHHLHPHFIVFFFWPLMMISRTWERSIILVSISMMSGCSLAPLMNSSSVNSPDDTSRRKEHIKISLKQQILHQKNGAGAAEHQEVNQEPGHKWTSLPSPLTSILSYIRVTISSGGISYVLVISWIAWQKKCNIHFKHSCTAPKLEVICIK